MNLFPTLMKRAVEFLFKRGPTLHLHLTTLLELDQEERDSLQEKLNQHLREVFLHQEQVQVTLLSDRERQIVKRIRATVSQRNLDNCTRTASYLEFYRNHPAVHWSFLAHLVSRNGGWAMTDLRGEPVGPLVPVALQKKMFHFLERCNYLIFGDAYPQLLIWEKSVELGTPLFHLLPHFGVSLAMMPIWDWFWEIEQRCKKSPAACVKHRVLLTHALIINEQNFIEERVVQNEKYAESVFHTLEFHAQKWLNLTTVFFPYEHTQKEGVRGAGVTVHDFATLSARITNGKQLYEVLFGNSRVLEGSSKWAFAIPHTGSRSDYNPVLFRRAPYPSTRRKIVIGDGCRLQKGSLALASPVLQEVWPQVTHTPPGRKDWCLRSKDMLDALIGTKEERKLVQIAHDEFDVTESYCSGIKLMEVAEGIESAFT